jgi:hypothetical protein
LVTDLAVPLLHGAGLDARDQLSLGRLAFFIVGGEGVLSGVFSDERESSVQLVESIPTHPYLKLIRVV